MSHPSRSRTSSLSSNNNLFNNLNSNNTSSNNSTTSNNHTTNSTSIGSNHIHILHNPLHPHPLPHPHPHPHPLPHPLPHSHPLHPTTSNSSSMSHQPIVGSHGLSVTGINPSRKSQQTNFLHPIGNANSATVNMSNNSNSNAITMANAANTNIASPPPTSNPNNHHSTTASSSSVYHHHSTNALHHRKTSSGTYGSSNNTSNTSNASNNNLNMPTSTTSTSSIDGHEVHNDRRTSNHLATGLNAPLNFTSINTNALSSESPSSAKDNKDRTPSRSKNLAPLQDGLIISGRPLSGSNHHTHTTHTHAHTHTNNIIIHPNNNNNNSNNGMNSTTSNTTSTNTIIINNNNNNGSLSSSGSNSHLSSSSSSTGTPSSNNRHILPAIVNPHPPPNLASSPPTHHATFSANFHDSSRTPPHGHVPFQHSASVHSLSLPPHSTLPPLRPASAHASVTQNNGSTLSPMSFSQPNPPPNPLVPGQQFSPHRPPSATNNNNNNGNVPSNESPLSHSSPRPSSPSLKKMRTVPSPRTTGSTYSASNSPTPLPLNATSSSTSSQTPPSSSPVTISSRPSSSSRSRSPMSNATIQTTSHPHPSGAINTVTMNNHTITIMPNTHAVSSASVSASTAAGASAPSSAPSTGAPRRPLTISFTSMEDDSAGPINAVPLTANSTNAGLSIIASSHSSSNSQSASPALPPQEQPNSARSHDLTLTPSVPSARGTRQGSLFGTTNAVAAQIARKPIQLMMEEEEEDHGVITPCIDANGNSGSEDIQMIPTTPGLSLNLDSNQDDESGSMNDGDTVSALPMPSFHPSNSNMRRSLSIDADADSMPSIYAAPMSTRGSQKFTMFPPAHVRSESDPSAAFDDEHGSTHASKSAKLAYFARDCTEITPFLFVSGKQVASDLSVLKKKGITHIVNCAGDICKNYFPNEFEYLQLFLLDSASEDIVCVLYTVFDFIDRARGISNHGSAQDGDKVGNQAKVLVHCQQGVSRSTVLVIAYLMYYLNKDYDEAYNLVRGRRGICRPNVGFMCQLLAWRKRCTGEGTRPFCLYRIAPHSVRDEKIVSKWVDRVELSALDSRGIFILHSFTSNVLFVWIGSLCTMDQLRKYWRVVERHLFRLKQLEQAGERSVIILQSRWHLDENIREQIRQHHAEHPESPSPFHHAAAPLTHNDIAHLTTIPLATTNELDAFYNILRFADDGTTIASSSNSNDDFSPSHYFVHPGCTDEYANINLIWPPEIIEKFGEEPLGIRRNKTFKPTVIKQRRKKHEELYDQHYEHKRDGVLNGEASSNTSVEGITMLDADSSNATSSSSDIPTIPVIALSEDAEEDNSSGFTLKPFALKLPSARLNSDSDEQTPTLQLGRPPSSSSDRPLSSSSSSRPSSGSSSHSSNPNSTGRKLGLSISSGVEDDTHEQINTQPTHPRLTMQMPDSNSPSVHQEEGGIVTEPVYIDGQDQKQPSDSIQMEGELLPELPALVTSPVESEAGNVGVGTDVIVGSAIESYLFTFPDFSSSLTNFRRDALQPTNIYLIYQPTQGLLYVWFPPPGPHLFIPSKHEGDREAYGLEIAMIFLASTNLPVIQDGVRIELCGRESDAFWTSFLPD